MIWEGGREGGASDAGQSRRQCMEYPLSTMYRPESLPLATHRVKIQRGRHIRVGCLDNGTHARVPGAFTDGEGVRPGYFLKRTLRAR